MEEIKLLGKKAKDKVTGVEGVITSVSFDLYGCKQAVVHPGTKDDGTIHEVRWFDICRLTITNGIPVMDNPFINGNPEKGPASKPCQMKS